MNYIKLKYLLLIILFFISSFVKAEIVTNSIGEKIKLNSDGTWEKLLTNNILLHQGSNKIFFEFKFWIDTAYLYRVSSVDSFTNQKKFKRLWTGCGGDGALNYKRKSDVIFGNFTMPLEFIGTKYEFNLLTLPVYRTVFKENNLIDLHLRIISGDKIESNNEQDIPLLTKQIQEICDWSNFTKLLNPSGSSMWLDVKFSDGFELDRNNFWEHATIELIKKDTIFKIIERTDR